MSGSDPEVKTKSGRPTSSTMRNCSRPEGGNRRSKSPSLGTLRKPDTKYDEAFPEGGTCAWLSVLGSLCGMMCCFGLMNTIGIFQTYIVHNQLKSYGTSDVGWIFGLYLFLAYFSGIQTGPLFDAQGPKVLMIAGSTCLVVSMLLLSVCKGRFSTPRNRRMILRSFFRCHSQLSLVQELKSCDCLKLLTPVLWDP